MRSPRELPYYYNRSNHQIFFGSISKYNDEQIDSITRDYLLDVVKYLFDEISNNEGIFVPVKNLTLIKNTFSKNEINYHLTDKYLILESQNKSLTDKFIGQFSDLFSEYFPISHFKYSTPRLPHSIEPFIFTENCFKFHELLPFPNYIIWASENPQKTSLIIDPKELEEWCNTKIKRIERIEITKVNDEIITFKPKISSNYLEDLRLAGF
jgi:hypothetical protein